MPQLRGNEPILGLNIVLQNLVSVMSYFGTIYYGTIETCSDISYQSGTDSKVI
jgi:hypothetical protein